MTAPGVGPSQPEDVTGDGVVSLPDRVEPGGQGSPDTNQGKAEPIPASATEPLDAPDLEDMSIGKAPSQLPSVGLDAPAPAIDSEVLTRLDVSAPVAWPAPVSGEDAHRTPGSLGATPEPLGTDVQAGAHVMGAGSGPGSGGDAAGVPVTGDAAAGGTSEEHDVVRGARTAEAE